MNSINTKKEVEVSITMEQTNIHGVDKLRIGLILSNFKNIKKNRMHTFT